MRVRSLRDTRAWMHSDRCHSPAHSPLDTPAQLELDNPLYPTQAGGRGVRLGLCFFVESLASMSSTGEMPKRLRIQFEGAIYHVMASASPSPTGR
jgi:hypothetical protein